MAEALRHFPKASAIFVAFSGGLDSCVLLHAAQRAAGQVIAIHIDHALQADSSRWAEQCAAVCATRDIPCLIERVDAQPAPGQSVEEAAREARYRALAAKLDGEGVLLTAHHLDDQAETVLLRLLRGSGADGLGGMRRVRPLGKGHLLRPFLGLSREALAQYARAHGLQWLEDPSNRDTRFDRNFLRRQVMPLLRQRWTAAPTLIARAAGHLRDAAELASDLAELDLQPVRHGDGTLSVSGVLALSPARQRNLLRRWLAGEALPLPSSRQLERIRTEALAARPDAGPIVHWPGCEVRRYRDRLHASPPLAPLPPAWEQAWDLEGALLLPGGLGRLIARRTRGAGLSVPALRGRRLRVTFRSGGERCRRGPEDCAHSVKQLFQSAGVPPWQRARIPLLWADDRLAAVVGHWECEPFRAKAGEEGVILQLTPIGSSAAIETEGKNNEN